jgi:hypothetical protein
MAATRLSLLNGFSLKPLLASHKVLWSSQAWSGEPLAVAIVTVRDVSAALSFAPAGNRIRSSTRYTSQKADALRCDVATGCKLMHTTETCKCSEGGKHLAASACTVLVRDSGDAFGRSATTGSLHFYFCILFSAYLFFSMSGENFRLVGTFDPENRKKNGIPSAKHIYTSVTAPL